MLGWESREGEQQENHGWLGSKNTGKQRGQLLAGRAIHRSRCRGRGTTIKVVAVLLIEKLARSLEEVWNILRRGTQWGQWVEARCGQPRRHYTARHDVGL